MKKLIPTSLILLVFALWGCAQAVPPSPTGTATLFEEDSVPQTDTPLPQEILTITNTTPTELAEATASSSSLVTDTPGTLDDYPLEGYGPAGFPENINPLTGLPIDSPNLLNRRPVAIKISNGPRGIRPQWGLSRADHVFEYYQEAERTRFNAIFYGNDASTAGPIRSARFVDEHIIRMYKSFFAFASADERVLDRLYGTELSERFASISDAPCPPTTVFPLCRTEPVGKNHLMTDTVVLREHFTQASVDSPRQPLDGFLFQASPPIDGTSPGGSVTLRYSKSFYNRWEYDPENRNYIRYQDALIDHAGGSGEEFILLTDRLTGEPLRADNVVVIIAEYIPFLVNPEIWEINLLGHGIAFLFRDGSAYQISWSRDSDEELIALTTQDGSVMPLRPGTTWFQIIGKSSLLTAHGANWRFEHQMP